MAPYRVPNGSAFQLSPYWNHAYVNGWNGLKLIWIGIEQSLKKSACHASFLFYCFLAHLLGSCVLRSV